MENGRDMLQQPHVAEGCFQLCAHCCWRLWQAKARKTRLESPVGSSGLMDSHLCPLHSLLSVHHRRRCLGFAQFWRLCGVVRQPAGAASVAFCAVVRWAVCTEFCCMWTGRRKRCSGWRRRWRRCRSVSLSCTSRRPATARRWTPCRAGACIPLAGGHTCNRGWVPCLTKPCVDVVYRNIADHGRTCMLVCSAQPHTSDAAHMSLLCPNGRKACGLVRLCTLDLYEDVPIPGQIPLRSRCFPADT